jgi:hypothetical protein
MSDNTAIIETLRSVRGVDDIIERLKSGSLEARHDKIAEALNKPEWKDEASGITGPLRLIGTYSHHVLAEREGVIVRIALKEDDEKIEFGKVEIFDVPVPATDIGAEIFETAKAAADAILSDSLDVAAPMISSIARALDIKGNLASQIESEVRLRSLTRNAWWQEVVTENYEGTEIELPKPRTEGEDKKSQLTGSVDDLLSLIKTEAAEALRAIQSLSERKNVHAVFVECANDISEDLKNAITALVTVDRENLDEMQRVFETVGLVAPRLLMGAKFLVQMANNS